MEFYVVEFQRKVREKNEYEEWEVVLMGHTVKRKATKACSSSVNPLESSHFSAWSKISEGKGRKKKQTEIVYSKADQVGKGLHLVKFVITDETVLPIVPFSLNENGTIPKHVAAKIELLLKHRVKEKENK